MKVVTLAISQLDTKDHIHDLMASMLDFPAWYGRNFDALYDCLTDLDEPVQLVIDHEGLTVDELPECTQTLLRIVDEAVEEGFGLTVEHVQGESLAVSSDDDGNLCEAVELCLAEENDMSGPAEACPAESPVMNDETDPVEDSESDTYEDFDI